MDKDNEKYIYVYAQIFMFVHKFPGKNKYQRGYVKKKFHELPCRAFKFAFLHRTQKVFIFLENLRAEILCLDVHKKLFLFFTLKNVFLNNGFICIREPNWISAILPSYHDG
jgi:hypothetical protein